MSIAQISGIIRSRLAAEDEQQDWQQKALQEGAPRHLRFWKMLTLPFLNASREP